MFSKPPYHHFSTFIWGIVCKRLGLVSYILKLKIGVDLRQRVDQGTSWLSEADIWFDDFPGVTSEWVTVDTSPIQESRRSTIIRKPPNRYF